jgi:hypothetical protein
MRTPAIAAACLLALAACNKTTLEPAPSASVVGAASTLTGAAGSAVAPTVAKSSVATSALSVACANAGPILDRYAATAFPAAAPFIPAAESAFNSFCKGALPNGTSTTAAAATVNTLLECVFPLFLQLPAVKKLKLAIYENCLFRCRLGSGFS